MDAGNLMANTSIVGTGLRGNVERLLRGDIRDKDLRELFLGMRDEFGGKGYVGEIANFLAHPGMRTQGPVTRETRDLIAFLKVRLPFSRSRIITTNLPASIPSALRANLRRMRKSTLKTKTGMGRYRAQQILEQVLSRITPSGAGRITKMKILNQEEEYDVVACVFSNVKGGSLFTDSDLFEDFCHLLQKRQLLLPKEKRKLKRFKAAISLFALIAMHNRTIDLGDGTAAKLLICPDPKRRLAIYAVAEVDSDASGRRAEVAGSIFETALPIAEYCENDVPPFSERTPFIGDFEMTPQLKLARLK
jgi:hypothetical protein